ncbi:MAG: tRNA adenosine(34) deaminase TadA [Bilophila sp.]
MALALEEARTAAGCGEVPVGAVVVAPDGEILSATHNQPVSLSDPSAHAEVLALRVAGQTLGNYRLEHCVLVVTLEPCLMCAGAAVHARLAGVVYGAADSKAGAVESCFNALDLPFHNHRVWHMGGVSSQACATLLQQFFMQSRCDAEKKTSLA